MYRACTAAGAAGHQHTPAVVRHRSASPAALNRRAGSRRLALPPCGLSLSYQHHCSMLLALLHCTGAEWVARALLGCRLTQLKRVRSCAASAAISAGVRTERSLSRSRCSPLQHHRQKGQLGRQVGQADRLGRQQGAGRLLESSWIGTVIRRLLASGSRGKLHAVCCCCCGHRRSLVCRRCILGSGIDCVIHLVVALKVSGTPAHTVTWCSHEQQRQAYRRRLTTNGHAAQQDRTGTAASQVSTAPLRSA